MIVSIILPVFRNARTLPELTRRLRDALESRGPYELLLVIDQSPDDSAPVATQLAACDPRVKVIELQHNIGQSRAILTGLALASGTIAVAMDADLQDPPEALPGLLDTMKNDPTIEALFATRVNRYSTRSRHVTSRLFKFTMRLLSCGRIPKNAGLFLAMRRPLYLRMAQQRHRDVHLVGLVARMTGRTAALPVPRAGADSGNYTPAMRLAVAWKSLRTLAGVPRKRNIPPVQVQSTVNLSPPAEPVLSPAV
jgi:glycosyltransferase involved in cell wall biosynthesis